MALPTAVWYWRFFLWWGGGRRGRKGEGVEGLGGGGGDHVCEACVKAGRRWIGRDLDSEMLRCL